ncbi:hypothetical protein [Streptomyces sp. NRRL S-1448]|uniref:hypothetical protein n=1 Tax=Streptomyces sp. NRRL S-1448 TaxID=1463883 RepID=UPI00131B6860|nr:hypothetical protein [Streptomyces sp. NRRL S-1448]
MNRNSWWCQANRSRTYNRRAEPLPTDCRAAESEHLADYGTSYAHALWKTGGWTHWAVTDPIPRPCPECGTEEVPLLTIASSECM